MITFNIILAQTLAGTVIEIIVLLLVAGMIGYFTSFYYYRSIYRKKINKLESDLKDLQLRNDGLLDQIIKLEKELEEKKK
jgi:cytochrome c-type biogenesis protein CcmH/NrfG